MIRQAKIIALLAFLALAVAGVAGQGATGVYQSDFGVLMLQQNGPSVTGTYEHAGGRVEGVLIGRTLTGWWYQTNGKGRLTFVFSEDFSSFAGKWSYENAEPSSPWNGKRSGSLIAPPNLVQPSPPPPPPIAGIYDTDFNEMTLRLEGNRVSGTYKYSDGRIEGTLEGRTLTGWWYQSNGKGRLIFTFSESFDSFVGKWSYEGAEPSGQWNGRKKSGLPASSPAVTPSVPPPPAPPAPMPPAPAPTVPQNLGAEIFNNWNKAGVSNGPASPTYFYVSKQTTVTRIINYHWNDMRGKAPGQVGLRGQDGRTYGPWQASGTSGTGGATNVNWIVYPNITLPPGLYQILDSDVPSWSYNGGSFGAGFSVVNGL